MTYTDTNAQKIKTFILFIFYLNLNFKFIKTVTSKF